MARGGGGTRDPDTGKGWMWCQVCSQYACGPRAFKQGNPGMLKLLFLILQVEVWNPER